MQKHSFSRNLRPLTDRRGFLLGSAIFINNDDLSSIQRFTEAHELMESLVIALREENSPRYPSNSKHRFEKDKENWCEQGAAALLMPSEMFYPLVARYGISLTTGKRLSELCQTSLTATIRRMLDSDLNPCIFTILREGHKKHQVVPSKIGQRVFWGKTSDWDPPAELRVWKYWRSPHTRRVLRHNESFPRDSLTYQVLASGNSGQIREAIETMYLDDIQGPHRLEAMRVTIEQTPSVMTLIHL